MLFYGTVADKSKKLYIGEFRKCPDKLLGVAHEKIADMLGALIKVYEANKKVKADDILHFHCTFKKVHPFEGGFVSIISVPASSTNIEIAAGKIPAAFRGCSTILLHKAMFFTQSSILGLQCSIDKLFVTIVRQLLRAK